MAGDKLWEIGFPNTANFFMGIFSLLNKSKKNTGSPATPYEAIGGEETVRLIANRFYDIMEQDPIAEELSLSIRSH